MNNVFIVCNHVADTVKESRSIISDSPAASRKVEGLANLLKSFSTFVTVLSYGRGRTAGSSKLFYPSIKKKDLRINYFYAPFIPIKIINYVISNLAIIIFLSTCRRGERNIVLFYNRSFYYFPVLICGMLLKFDLYLDLEDGELELGAPYLSQKIKKIWLRCFDKICHRGVILANTHLVDSTIIKSQIVYYGIIDASKAAVKDLSVLNVLFSGSLERDTGSALFCDMLKYFERNHSSLHEKIRFFVTGKGEGLKQIESCARQARNNGVSVEVLGAVPQDRYIEILRRSSVGLSLKLSSGVYSQSTFPSKVIEYAEYGLVVCSTEISDVRKLFGCGAARFLEVETPASICAELEWLWQNRQNIPCISKKAIEHLEVGLSYKKNKKALERLFKIT